MNKKLKIYSSLFVVVLIVFAISSISVYYRQSVAFSTDRVDEKLEFTELPAEFVVRDTLENGIVKTSKTVVSYDVFVEPKQAEDRKELISTSHHQTYKIDMQKVRLSVPASRTTLANFPVIFAFTSIILITIVIVWIFYMVYKLVRSIRKGEIFVAQVAKYLETTGFLLVALYLYELISTFILSQYYIKNIHLADYNIVFKNDCNSMYIITGLAIMIISQIILMGKELKEEQELTI